MTNESIQGQVYNYEISVITAAPSFGPPLRKGQDLVTQEEGLGKHSPGCAWPGT